MTLPSIIRHRSPRCLTARKPPCERSWSEGTGSELQDDSGRDTDVLVIGNAGKMGAHPVRLK